MSQAREMGRLTKDLCQASELRKSTIDAMRQATKSMLTACARARGEMVREYRLQAHRFLVSLTRDVAAHHRATANHIAQTRKSLGAMAKDVAAQRNATMNQIARLASARRKAASQLWSSLQRQVGAIVDETRELRNAAAQIMPALASDHQKMAKRQRASLDAGHRKLHANMTRILGAIHADRMKAREIWSDFKLGGAA
jgi:uncharacterized protein YdbL (DUF1318 family)